MNMNQMNQMDRMRPQMQPQMPQMGRGMGRDMPSSQMLQGPQGDMNGMRMQQQMQRPLRPQMQPQMPDMPQLQEQMQNRMRMMSDDDLSGLLKQMQQQTAPSVNPEGIAGSLLGRPPMSEMQRRMMDQRMMAPRFGTSFGVQR